MADDSSDLHYPASRQLKQIGSYTSEREKAREPVDLSSPEVIKAHDIASRKMQAEFKASSRDENFKTKVFWVALTVFTLADYLYLPVVFPGLKLHWFVHSAIVVSATFLSVFLIKWLHILRSLRRLVKAAIVLALILVACALLGLLPHAY